ncbi:uncharacterized protein BT62DRAFT_1081673 [Guyanagaster necrorhizus]|uniref:Phospholipase/carboxylesterase/thioesterase domain-containing protein n=1 Tax=Guyanagaster necrorhizus TaxID=856835 RepID=A0A9P7VFZ3_9AGAR|nr:uncharacterized protein BT62DRAFT_1081673 [Guyanagaster necrorhizus MCA 3950]KAG7439289.1 hypothetical protein BT62DRAFT_1081673 [Guyanagaster necrorhizus MCA 3950]
MYSIESISHIVAQEHEKGIEKVLLSAFSQGACMFLVMGVTLDDLHIAGIMMLSEKILLADKLTEARIIIGTTPTTKYILIFIAHGTDDDVLTLDANRDTYLVNTAAWGFFNKSKGTLPWDLTVINPPNLPLFFPFYFFHTHQTHHPFINEVPNPQSLGYAVNEWYNVVVRGDMSAEDIASGGHCWVHVRDFTEAHIRTLFVDAARGERMVVSAGPYVWQDWRECFISFLSAHRRLTCVRKWMLQTLWLCGHVGVPGVAVGPKYLMNYDTGKQERIFGLGFRTKADTARDVLN